jgi:hypothetical protein
MHLGFAHNTARPARPSGLAALGISAHDRRNRGGGIPFNSGGLPAKSDRSMVIPIWGEGRWEAHRGRLMVAMAVRRRGALVRRVGRLSLHRLVMSASTLELG